MPTPAEFVQQYHSLQVAMQIGSVEFGQQPLLTFQIALRTYFMMNWTAGSTQLAHYHEVTGPAAGPGAHEQNLWFAQHRDRIRTAAMGKGAPLDYRYALEWAIRSGDVADPTQATLQAYCDLNMGIDCSGFATNYLCAAGRRAYSSELVRGTSAQSYYRVADAVQDPADVQQGDLLVWMTGNQPKSDPGHVAVVQSYVAASTPGGNMEVCEATGAGGASPKVLCSRYEVTRIVDRNSPGLNNAVMILECTRHGTRGSTVCVMRPQ